MMDVVDELSPSAGIVFDLIAAKSHASHIDYYPWLFHFGRFYLRMLMQSDPYDSATQ